MHAEFFKAKKMISEIYTYFLAHPEALGPRLKVMELEVVNPEKIPFERIVCDFIASITDRYILELHHEIFVPTPLV